jgi:SpoVK/Ycf46/Vps4 family AAA+-type ATPase
MNAHLPHAQPQILREIASSVETRPKAGICALFAGDSGTGRIKAAATLARVLHFDLYRVDLSAVLSKYIGETEKNLQRIFDDAKAGGAILFFDEADPLFGTRSGVKDSHDRYAHRKLKYLLQRIKAYRGLTILSTNKMPALDPLLRQQIRFVVQFPIQDATNDA